MMQNFDNSVNSKTENILIHLGFFLALALALALSLARFLSLFRFISASQSVVWWLIPKHE